MPLADLLALAESPEGRAQLDTMAAEQVMGYEVYTNPATFITVYRVPQSPHVMIRADDLPFVGSLDGAAKVEAKVIETVGMSAWWDALLAAWRAIPQQRFIPGEPIEHVTHHCAEAARADARTRVVAALLAVEGR